MEQEEKTASKREKRLNASWNGFVLLQKLDKQKAKLA